MTTLNRELHAEEILRLEFEYARETAYQSQNDRTTIVNLYLILVGGVGSFLLGSPLLTGQRQIDLPPQVLALAPLLLALVGFLTLFKLVRLRQAWHSSVKEMNSVKDYYLQQFPDLASAIRWRTDTIPARDKAWTITYILSLLVMLIDSIALASGVYLLGIRSGTAGLLIALIAALLGFGLQGLFYYYQLSSHATTPEAQDAQEKRKRQV